MDFLVEWMKTAFKVLWIVVLSLIVAFGGIFVIAGICVGEFLLGLLFLAVAILVSTLMYKIFDKYIYYW